MNNFLVDYNLFIQLSYSLLDSIKKGGKEYKAVLCPLRGGYFLSYFMSKHLSIPMVYIEITSYSSKERRDFHIGIKPVLEKDIFLLCDDIYDSGNTIKKIHSMYPDVLFDTICLISKVKEANINYGKYIEPGTWIDFFWEIM